MYRAVCTLRYVTCRASIAKPNLFNVLELNLDNKHKLHRYHSVDPDVVLCSAGCVAEMCLTFSMLVYMPTHRPLSYIDLETSLVTLVQIGCSTTTLHQTRADASSNLKKWRIKTCAAGGFQPQHTVRLAIKAKQ